MINSLLISIVVLCSSPLIPSSLAWITSVPATTSWRNGLRSNNNQRENYNNFKLTATSDNASICIVGGGVSGLSAAIIAAKETKKDDDDDSTIIVLEAGNTIGGRVQSDNVQSGYVLDRGFAVFIEEYPYAKELLDYNTLQLNKFLPGALVKIDGSNQLARVADPLRIPSDLLTALLAPVGTLVDKLAVLRLVFHVRTNTIEELFAEPETDTLTALQERWGFSNDIITKFFRPFLEGIYLAPLNEQSSRMFTFVFKMFSEGSATLPTGGIGSVAQQLAQKAIDAGVQIQTNQRVGSISKTADGYIVKSDTGKEILEAKSLIVATEGNFAKQILSTLEGLESLESEPDQTQRVVGCLYYAFDGPAPVTDPILILNGIGLDGGKNPVNNVCFPSVVSSSYAPAGSNLCSVTILKPALDLYDDVKELDFAVRNQLATWFPDYSNAIKNQWKLLQFYKIPNAQPAQYDGPYPANVNGGRNPNTYRGITLPNGLYVCGDHIATATLNGALESGVIAGRVAARAAARVATTTTTTV